MEEIDKYPKWEYIAKCCSVCGSSRMKEDMNENSPEYGNEYCEVCLHEVDW